MSNPCQQEDTLFDIKTDIALLKQSDVSKEKKLDKIDGNVSKIVYFMLGTFASAIGTMVAVLLEVFK